MKIVIQCAGSKVTCAEPDGHMQTKEGKPVMFVAQPPGPRPDIIYATPDDLSDRQVSWRTLLQEYNKSPGDNPWKLRKAYTLYENEIYGALEKKFGVDMYVLSAGWGLIRADFLTPQYDITFKSSADYYKRRKKTDHYRDFNMLTDDGDDPIVFFGGKDYVRLFCSLTAEWCSRRKVFYNSAKRPDAPGCDLERFDTKARTNWHYECAKAFLDSSTEISF